MSTTHAAPPAPPAATKLTGIIGSLALAAFLMILNETVLSVALPAIMEDLQVSAAAGQWLTTGFLLTMSVLIPLTGYLIQRFRTRTLFAFALLSFIIGTLIAFLAPSFAVLLIARIIQAVGTAIIMPLLMTTTLQLVPRERRGTVMGLNSIVISVGPAVGPTVSGAIVNAFSWNAIFLIMLPLAAVILVAGLIFIRVPDATRRTPVDIASVILSALAFGLLVYGISSLEHAVDNLTMTIASFLIGLVALGLFIRRQLRLTREGRELLNLSPFTNRSFTLSVLLIMIGMGTLLGTLMMLPIILESGAGHSTLAIGLMLLPGGLAQAISAPIFGRVFDRHGPRPVLIPGAILLAAGQWLYLTVNAETPLWTFGAIHVVFSIGMALLMTGLMSSALSTVPPQHYGHGSAIFTTAQQLGGAIGTTMFVTIFSMLSARQLTAGEQATAALFDGAHSAFIVGAIITTAAIAIAPLITLKRQSR
ncbi:MDR family MFS transporter [Glutamicibacter sp. X7]